MQALRLIKIYWLKAILPASSIKIPLANRRHYLLSTQISASLSVLALGLFIIIRSLTPENTIIQIWLLALIGLLIIGIILAALGRPKFSPFFISVGLPVLLLLSTIHSKLLHPNLIHEGSFYNPRFFLLGLAVLPLIVYDFKQKTTMAICLIVNVGLLVFYNPIHSFFGASPNEIMGVAIKNYDFISKASALSALALVLAMFFLKMLNFKYEKRIEFLLQTTSTQHEELKSSVRYAQRLQQNIIPDLKSFPHLQKRLELVYRPKDIVSGDFFVLQNSGSKIHLGVIDCTGHGVPGAFLSIVAHNNLQNAFNQFGTAGPGKILDELNKTVRAELTRSQESNIYDSMDISLFEIDEDNKSIKYAGAKGAAIIYKAGETLHLPFERRSIGDDNSRRFAETKIEYSEGDQLIVYSDGFIDQFGGPENKKFGNKRFREHLNSTLQSDKDLRIGFFNKLFDAWKGIQDQTDDVCLVHLRF